MPMPDRKSAQYLHDGQRARIKQLASTRLWRWELPTWGLILFIYAGWFATVGYWTALGPWIGTPLLIWFTTWYMSLQHELIHGHPTRLPWLNRLFGLPPLAVWYPYGLYRDSHLRHHRDDRLTDPDEDPEGYYFSAERWRGFSPLRRRLARWHNTFAGRLLIGPALDIYRALRGMAFSVAGGDRRAIGMWLTHGALLAALLYWVALSGLSVGYFLLAISYPALAMTKIRSFMEHRAAREPEARSVINEAAWPWRLLFLNLNYHLVHHDLPTVPWYVLRRVYLADRDAYQRRAGGFVVRGYAEWLGEYAFRPAEVEVHPSSLTDRRLSEASGPVHADFTTDVRYQSR
ncbi:fatty acid desaturase [Acerihabitans arboris]|uniref:Fatty acid desaturase n=1 Tax=Acerihabitans arboris TaxID=2691583 RepID=A0A845SQR8_9GAMM|nr:fatty acid desaturase [Acerihabitans arboris]NDL64948.1 fatty acid desaturase [Acerihabitans arboris]